MIEVGAGFWCVQRTISSPVSLAAMYRETKAEVAHAARVGFDTAWFGEHHFSYDGYLPSPLLGMAAVSPVPDPIRLATGVLIVPLHEPARVASAVAALRGVHAVPPRVTLGQGYRDEELIAMGVEPGQRLKRFVRHLDELLEGGYAGELGDAEIWLGGSADPQLARAARRGLPILLPSSFGRNGLAHARSVYDDHLEPRFKVEPRVGITKEVWVDDDPRRLGNVRARLASMWRHYASSWTSEGPDQMERRERDVTAITNKAIVGSAQMVLDELGALVEAGADALACRVRFDSTDSSWVIECLDRLAADVVPHLRRLR